MTVLLLPLRGQPDSPQWGVAQDEWNARHTLGPPTADGVFREPLPPPPGQPTAAQQALGTIQVPGFFTAKVAWWDNRWATGGRQVGFANSHAHVRKPCPIAISAGAMDGRGVVTSAVIQASAVIHPFFHVARVLHWDEVGLEWHVVMRFVGPPCEWIVRFTPRPSSRDAHTVKVPGVRTGPRARHVHHHDEQPHGPVTRFP
jgi:hypothetical protein